MTIDEFKTHARQVLCDGEWMLTDDDAHGIEQIELEYLSDAFIYGKNPRYTLVKRGRIDGVGELEVHIEMKNDIIMNMNLMGDYFLLGDQDNGIIEKLRGLPLTHKALFRALPDRIDDIIMNLMKEDFVRLLIS